MAFHILPTFERGNEKGAVIGRVKHRRENPLEYEIKVVKKGSVKVFVGNKGVFVIEDDLAKEIIKALWEKYVRETYGRRKPKTNKEIVEHPIEVRESFLINFFKEKGFITSFKSCMYLIEGTSSDESTIKDLILLTKKIKEKVTKTT
ncbi:hypothetical protein [Aquifex aeolicus]|uniref:Uncharacterized protein aq_aa37 n=1 Tax=Aquifex aeolicus (strain VF5) TaxID=224324 RepID=YZ37_AQUAE|nr:hypothetical protein [Aquifex aeolicus]O66425.1 RecName: Full=Uncharacterized protein aq_aa37 [Aquifex aeolicus VF5]AAC07977.1 putative protein [Aquifex aeolicus VF5]